MNAFTRFTKEEIISFLKSSDSVTDVLRKVGLSTNGSGTRKSLQKVCKEFEIFDLYVELKSKGKHSYRQKSHPKLSLTEMLTENSSVSRGRLKERLLKEELIKNVCSECGCGLSGLWNGKKITMVLDHINGINNDNRLENLRMLCPNCNSQQDTFAGRNAKKVKKCAFCRKEHSKNTRYCSPECKSVARKIREDASEKNLNSRFWSKVDIKEKDDCWNWTLSLDQHGYGSFRYDRKNYNSHKMAWIITYGNIPKETWVIHTCENNSCCNPAHLYLATRSERMKRAVKEGTSGLIKAWAMQPDRSGENNTKHTLFISEVSEIRNLIKTGVRISTIARKYKVNRQTIADIKYNKTWKNIGV
jgi:Zn finger protein HypA/HybF involved in hydrogenase expression